MAFIASHIHKWLYIWARAFCLVWCMCVCVMCSFPHRNISNISNSTRQQHNDNDNDDENGNDDDEDDGSDDNKSDRNDKYLGLNCIAKIHRESRLKFTTKRLFVTLNMGSIYNIFSFYKN